MAIFQYKNTFFFSRLFESVARSCMQQKQPQTREGGAAETT